MNGRTNRHFVFNFSFFSLQEGYFLCVLKRTKYWESWNLRFLRNKKVPVLSDPEILEFPWKQNELRPLDLFSHVSAWFFSTLYTNTHTHTHTHTHTFLFPSPSEWFLPSPPCPCPTPGSSWLVKAQPVVRCNVLPCFAAIVTLVKTSKLELNSGSEKQSHSERMGNYLLREIRWVLNLRTTLLWRRRQGEGGWAYATGIVGQLCFKKVELKDSIL